MRNLKFLLCTACIIFTSSILYSQNQWSGNDNTIDDIYRIGSVGIGTSNLPSAKLNIRNNINWLPTFLINHESNTPWSYAMLIKVDNDNVKAFNIQTTNGANLFRIMGNGVVNAKKIYAEEIEVRVDAMVLYWPDYVFAKDYKLKSLQELEIYINENGHLPDVPSVHEVKESGINLGEINAALLKKVEELTLYIIEQEKRIAQLEKIVIDN